MIKKIILPFITAIVLLSSCKQIQKATDVITQPTAREMYERNFEKGDPNISAWKYAFETARRDSLQITLPYLEHGVFDPASLSVYSYNLQLREGEKIIVEIDKTIDSVSVFIDLFQIKKDTTQTLKPMISNDRDAESISFDIAESSFYKIIVQPEMSRQTAFSIKIYARPSYAFPVSGVDNKAIQSFWADVRDGGNRSHEGVDIFADKGTPVIAVTDGRVGFTGERGLGGKQVWLRDGLFGKSIYYAHLDSINVKSGITVKRGDTLGFVGNTGNAKTTKPHLHFGIYKSTTGPVNPLPYIKITEIPEFEKSLSSVLGKIKSNNATIRKGPSTAFREILNLKKSDSVQILGKAEKWYHISAADTLKGFMHESLVEEIPLN